MSRTHKYCSRAQVEQQGIQEAQDARAQTTALGAEGRAKGQKSAQRSHLPSVRQRSVESSKSNEGGEQAGRLMSPEQSERVGGRLEGTPCAKGTGKAPGEAQVECSPCKSFLEKHRSFSRVGVPDLDEGGFGPDEASSKRIQGAPFASTASSCCLRV